MTGDDYGWLGMTGMTRDDKGCLVMSDDYDE